MISAPAASPTAVQRRTKPRPRAVVGLLLAVLLVGPGGPASAAEPVEAVLARLAAARQLAAEAADDPGPERMDAVRERLGPATQVELAGTPVRLAPREHLADLDGRQGEALETAATRLGLVERELAAAADAPARERAEVEAALEQAYAGVRAEPTALERLNRLVGDVLAGLVRAAGEAEGLARLLLVVGFAALVAALAVWLVRRLTLVPDRAADTAGSSEQTRIDWRARREDALARGDLDTAVRAAYRSLLVALDTRGLLRDRPSLTAAGVRRQLAVDGTLRPKTEAATVAFERVVYAGEPPSPAAVATIVEAEREADRR